MSIIKYSNTSKSPQLQGIMVESILKLLSVREVTVNDLLIEIERKMHLSRNRLKKHLVCLIDYELVTYNGQSKLLVIEEDGLVLLDKINTEKEVEMVGSEDIIITIEKDTKTGLNDQN